MLAHQARLAELRRRGLWPPQLPAVVLAEVLTGDHRRDFHTNHLLGLCQIRDVTERLARDAAVLRTRTRRRRNVAATDAIVAAFACTLDDPIILTSDLEDLEALVARSQKTVRVARA